MYFLSMIETFVYFSAWLNNKDNAILKNLNRRIEAYTGLDLTTAEPLQVAILSMTTVQYSWEGRYNSFLWSIHSKIWRKSHEN